MSFNTWEHFDSPKTLFPYCNQSLNSNERAKWLELQLACKGDKSAEQAVSNTLANLKKSGAVSHEGRIYRWAQAE